MKKSKKIFKRTEKEKSEVFPLPATLTKTISLEFDGFTEFYEDVDLSECIQEESKYLNIKKLVKLLERNYNISFLSSSGLT